MKANHVFSRSFLLILLLALSAGLVWGQQRQNKRSWTFTNNTGQAANDLHIELVVGTVPVNIVTNPADGTRRAGGVFTEFPESGSPGRHDYAGGTVANGAGVNLQFKDNTRPSRWWWTLDGRRIGEVQGLNSPDLAAVIPMDEWPDQLITRATGTGRTTGHIADLSVTNPAEHPVIIEPGPCYIPSEGKYQSYAAMASEAVRIAAGATENIALQGYCADIFTRPAPAGAPLPPVSDWITTAQAIPLPVPGDVFPTANGWRPRPEGSGIVTFPGTDIPLPYTLDSRKNPEAFATLALDALQRIAATYDELGGTLQTPFSGNPGKERETVIQQTFWLYTADLSGREYKLDDFARNTYRQYAEASGKDPDRITPEEKENLQDGIDQFWGVFQTTGAEAKVIRKEEETLINDEAPKPKCTCGSVSFTIDGKEYSADMDGNLKKVEIDKSGIPRRIVVADIHVVCPCSDASGPCHFYPDNTHNAAQEGQVTLTLDTRGNNQPLVAGKKYRLSTSEKSLEFTIKAHCYSASCCGNTTECFQKVKVSFK